ncbi:hypothetical protein TrLO_g14491 [Triparma laevis f. longispina]|uniref:Uncharacterized protein n=1 Tax=Triparma laevis f. longispina TaxID=1714387 RepID=A0A9W7AA67_9STRA|nr:hypothetical protein TrLO_g14491 [Triparma laevis f. longispina]
MQVLLLIFCLLLLILPSSSAFFLKPLTFINPQSRLKFCLNCICINCKWVDKCGAYHFVEEKHEQPHIWKPKTAADTKPPFEPRDGSPTIEVNIRRIPVDDEEERSFYELAADTTNHQKPISTNKATTVEYDVVACADFVPEQDRWINNMPEEIKLKNPDFVPT